jgi:hypothetical protein
MALKARYYTTLDNRRHQHRCATSLLRCPLRNDGGSGLRSSSLTCRTAAGVCVAVEQLLLLLF